jgi:hypothetical protein
MNGTFIAVYFLSISLAQDGKFHFKVKTFLSLLACIHIVSVTECSSAREDCSSEPCHQDSAEGKRPTNGKKI